MELDLVNHPPHYETNGIECIDAMRASQGDDAVKDFCICNAFKYIWRHSHKGSEIQDLEKAVWYLNKAIEIAKNSDEDRSVIWYRCKACGLTFQITAGTPPCDEILLIRHLEDDHHHSPPGEGYSAEDMINNWYEKIC